MKIRFFGKSPKQWIVEDENTISTNIPHYTILKKLGARFHRDEIRACYDFRFATFTISSASQPMTIRIHLKLLIPFMKNDMGIRFYVCKD